MPRVSVVHASPSISLCDRESTNLRGGERRPLRKFQEKKTRVVVNTRKRRERNRINRTCNALLGAKPPLNSATFTVLATSFAFTSANGASKKFTSAFGAFASFPSSPRYNFLTSPVSSRSLSTRPSDAPETPRDANARLKTKQNAQTRVRSTRDRRLPRVDDIFLFPPPPFKKYAKREEDTKMTTTPRMQRA